MWWIPLLKGLALSQLAQRGGKAGQIGSYFLGQAWNKKPGEATEPQNQFWTYNEDEGIPGMDWPQQSLYGSRYGDQSLTDLVYRILLDQRMGRR